MTDGQEKREKSESEERVRPESLSLSFCSDLI